MFSDIRPGDLVVLVVVSERVNGERYYLCKYFDPCIFGLFFNPKDVLKRTSEQMRLKMKEQGLTWAFTRLELHNYNTNN